MKWSRFFLPTLREVPKDAEAISHKLMVRAAVLIALVLSAGLIPPPMSVYAERIRVKDGNPSLDAETDNAAFYYSNAFNLMVYPGSEDLENKMFEIIRSGWRGEEQALEQIVTQDEVWLQQFRTGLALDHCDFPQREGWEDPLVRDEPPLLDIMNLANLLHLKARYEEKEQAFGPAVEIYLSLLTFSQHVAQTHTLTGQMLALGIERRAVSPLKELVASGEAGKQLSDRIFEFLVDYERRRFPIGQIEKVEQMDRARLFESTGSSFFVSQPYREGEKTYLVVLQELKELRDLASVRAR